MIPSPFQFFRKLKMALTPIEDQWTLTDLNGEVYEEVEVESLTSSEVTFKHRVGKVRLPLEVLTEDSQLRLLHGFQETQPEAQHSEERSPESVDLHKPTKGFQGA